jgi:hypothetical protein
MTRTQLWSSGGGTQSAGIAALIVMGELRPDLAVIADTGRESSATWAYHDKIIVPALASVGVTLHRVSRQEFEWRDLYGGKDNDTLLIPAFTTHSGEVGKLPSYCSSYWKRDIVKRWANAQGVGDVDRWLGYSLDEAWRARGTNAAVGHISGKKWGVKFPLLERAMNRADCEALVRRMGWPAPPRSSCWICPNHTQDEWREMRDFRPVDWRQAVAFDHQLRDRDPNVWLHSDCVPLDQADLSDANGVLFEHRCSSGECFS